MSRAAADIIAEIDGMSPSDKLRLAAGLIEEVRGQPRERVLYALGVARRIASNVADELALVDLMAKKP